MSVSEIVALYNEAYTRKNLLTKGLRVKRRKQRRLIKDIKALEKGRFILTEAAKVAQEQIKTEIESLLTLVIRGVFNRPMTFKLIFEEKRNHVEARPVIIENGEEYIPKDDLGGSIIDIIAIATRIILWYISNPRSRNLFLLDEPFRFTGGLIGKAGKMLQFLSKKLKFQVLMVSHDDSLIEICDRVYRVTHNGTESIVKCIKGRKIKRR